MPPRSWCARKKFSLPAVAIAADALISDGWAATYLPGVSGRPVDDVLKGVDTALFTPQGPNLRAAHGLERNRVILCVTRLVPIKNLPLLIDAVAEPEEVGPSLHTAT